MANYQYMMSAKNVAKELNCSKSHAYKLIKSMNKEWIARAIGLCDNAWANSKSVLSN